MKVHFWRIESVSTLPHSGISKSTRNREKRERGRKNYSYISVFIFLWNIEGGACCCRSFLYVFYIPCVKTSFVEHKVSVYTQQKRKKLLYLQKMQVKSRNVTVNIPIWQTTPLLYTVYIFHRVCTVNPEFLNFALLKKLSGPWDL